MTTAGPVIALDAMAGDNAHSAIVEGSVIAERDLQPRLRRAVLSVVLLALPRVFITDVVVEERIWRDIETHWGWRYILSIPIRELGKVGCIRKAVIVVVRRPGVHGLVVRS